jgi:hypothetical protein
MGVFVLVAVGLASRFLTTVSGLKVQASMVSANSSEKRIKAERR